MADITLRRCTVKVVRLGGWSWGREPRQLVNDVMRALPSLLATELEHHVPDEAEGEITAPLRVHVRTSLRELREWIHANAGAGETRDAASDRRVNDAASPASHAVGEALRRALAGARLAERIHVHAPPPARRDPVAREPGPDERAAVLMRALRAFRSVQALETLLRDLPEQALLAWHQVLLGGDASDRTPAETADFSHVRRIQSWSGRADGASAVERVRLRLLAAGELIHEVADAPSRHALRATVDAAIAPDAAQAVARHPPPVISVVGSTTRACDGFEAHVASALPFLLLGPLHRIGWLEMLHATFSGANLCPALPDFAVALATKLLPEPERGWRRAPAHLRAAAVFAGDSEPRDESALVEMARAATPLVPALDAVIRRSLLDGRSTDDALMVCAAGDVRLVVDPPGVFLVSHAEQVDGLTAALLDARAPVFVPEQDADTEMLATLDAAGVTFVTPARPVRDECWSPIPGTRAPRLYSNRRAACIVPVADSVAQRTRETWEAFQRRPLPGRLPDPALDRSLSLAAALALGTIAWELWRRRESTDALLALERFGDLDGTVRFDAHQVRVRLPMGKRFRDLKEGGLLEDVPRVPWLDFRTLVFAGG